MCLSNYSSIYPSIYLSVCLSIYLSESIYLFCRTPLDIWTLKSDPKRMCFVHVDLQTRFSPQRRAIFPHPNFKKWSKSLMFLTFWLSNVLRATAACHFSTSALPKMLRYPHVFSILNRKMLRATAACHVWTAELQKVVRRWFVLCMLIWKCASRYRGVQFFCTSQLQKVVQSPHAFNILTFKCAARHSRVPLFDIRTSKNAPRPSCF